MDIAFEASAAPWEGISLDVVVERCGVSGEDIAFEASAALWGDNSLDVVVDRCGVSGEDIFDNIADSVS